MPPFKSWACANFRVSENDPYFCANCGDFASMHEGPTPGAPRQVSLNRETPLRPMDPEWTAEHAIAAAVAAVEAMPSHSLLTEAVILLNRAKDKVTDYLDDMPKR